MSVALMNTYNPLPISLAKGDGVWVWDTQGNKYLDAFAGIAVMNLGHNHPAVTKSLIAQAQKLVHTSNAFQIKEQQELAQKLTNIAQMDNVFFANSGAEANECAIKMARLYGNKKAIDNPTIIVAERSFHGRTLATLTASGSRRVQAGFEPLVQGFLRVPYNDLPAIAAIAKHAQNVVAVMVEPIQGESGVSVPADDYLNGIRKLCDEHDWLMILDEVQTGIGRTGKWFAHFHNDGIKPDIMTSAKALGNGIPIGACLASGAAKDILGPGNHGSTYGGNPLCCAVALSVLSAIEESDVINNATSVGSFLLQQLKESLSGIDGVIEVRGKGLMIGVELNRPTRELMAIGAQHGLLFNTAGLNTIRLVPPLIITEEHAKQIVETLQRIIPPYCAAAAPA